MKPSDEGKVVVRRGGLTIATGPATGEGDGGKHFCWDYERWWEPIGQYHVFTTEEHGFFPDWNTTLLIQAPRTEDNDQAIRDLIERLDEMAERLKEFP